MLIVEIPPSHWRSPRTGTYVVAKKPKRRKSKRVDDALTQKKRKRRKEPEMQKRFKRVLGGAWSRKMPSVGKYMGTIAQEYLRTPGGPRKAQARLERQKTMMEVE